MWGVGRRSFMTVAGSLVTMAATGTPALATGHAHDAASASEYVDVQLLSITDLHGYLQAPPAGDAVITGAGGEQLVVGGVPYLAAHLKALRAGRANSIFFAPGDLFSGWEFPAETLADEPTIEALNRMGLDFATAGNHEFDRTPGFMIDHMEQGRPYTGAGWTNSFPDSTGRTFPGANFRYYCANMLWENSGKTVLPPVNVEWVQGPGARRLPIGFIHLTVTGTETSSTGFQTALRMLDELQTANRYAALLKSQGVNAIVLSMHDGAVAGSDFNSGTEPTGPAYDLALAASPDIDAIVTGHWHCAFNMMVPDPAGRPRPFIEAGCHAQMINEINLRLDPVTGSVVRALTTSTNHPNTHDVTPDQDLKETADYWTGYAQNRGATRIGRQTASFTRTLNSSGESTMGNLAADWALWAGAQPLDPFDTGNIYSNVPADLALIALAPRQGPSVINTDLTLDATTQGAVSYRKAFNAVGYGNPILTATVTGQSIHDALEQQWAMKGTVLTYAPLAVSHNVRYTFDAAGSAGNRVNPADVLIDGTPLDPHATYRLATTAYTLIGADDYPALLNHTEPVRHTRDFESFVAYVQSQSVLTPAPLGRVSPRNTTALRAETGRLMPLPRTLNADDTPRVAVAGGNGGPGRC
ncbi:bifunctional metallophosphatase/5'-nucleotidase [Streptomyces sp. NPDC052000]|uniref:bifunctional metallophosphatase/5'-nucleotidase n=1 Tax=Streptomyces sp. NPDC052000 TaxID=3155676 RepID=UPI00344D1326